MGTLAGHVVPGVFFIIYGGWWSFISIWSHLKRGSTKLSYSSLTYSKKLSSRRECGGNVAGVPAPSFALYKQERRDHEQNHRSWIPQPFCTPFPLEPLVKFFCSMVGIVVECVDIVTDPVTSRTYPKLYTVTNPNDGSFNDLSQLQHITMYSAFALSGLVDLLTLRVRCPDHTSQLFLALAFLVEGALFHFHTVGMTPLSTQLHVTLTVVIFLCSLFALLRVWFPTSYLVNTGLALTMVLQGTWFVQVGDILYGGHYLSVVKSGGDTEHMESHEHVPVRAATMTTTPMHSMGNASAMVHDGSDNAHNDIMFASALFTWHLIAVLLFILVEWIIVNKAYRSWKRCRSRAVKVAADAEAGGDQDGVGEEEKLMEDVTLTRDADL